MGDASKNQSPGGPRISMDEVDSNQSTQTNASKKEDERESFRITPEIAKEWAKELREEKRNERLRKLHATSILYWIVDDTPDDYPGHFDDLATTRAQRRRVHVRSWVSWPNLGRLAEKEIFGVGLGAVMLVPAASGFLDIVEPFLRKLFPGFQGLGLPLQAEVLFFSGLFFVIGNVLYFFRCPAIVKNEAAHAKNLPTPPMHDKIILAEAAFFLSHFVYSTFITKEKLQEIDISLSVYRHVENSHSLHISKLRKDEREVCEHFLRQGIALPRIGFDGYGRYLVERFLLTSVESRGGRLFIKEGIEHPWKAVEGARPLVADEFSLYDGLLHHPKHYLKEAEGSTEKDMFLEWYLASATKVVEFEKGGPLVKYIDYVLHNFDIRYFENCDFNKMANLLAEWQYYMRPWSRIAVAMLFMTAVGLLAVFLVLQTVNVLQL